MGFETERTEGGVVGESRIKFSVPITYKKHINEVPSRCFQDRYRQNFQVHNQDLARDSLYEGENLN